MNEKDFSTASEYFAKLAAEDEAYYQSEEWKKDGYVSFGYRKQIFDTSFGPIEFSRRYYYDRLKQDGYFYLDRKFGLVRQKKITAEIREQVAALYGEVKVIEIARKFGISRQSVHAIAKESGKL